MCSFTFTKPYVRELDILVMIFRCGVWSNVVPKITQLMWSEVRNLTWQKLKHRGHPQVCTCDPVYFVLKHGKCSSAFVWNEVGSSTCGMGRWKLVGKNLTIRNQHSKILFAFLTLLVQNTAPASWSLHWLLNWDILHLNKGSRPWNSGAQSAGHVCILHFSHWVCRQSLLLWAPALRVWFL